MTHDDPIPRHRRRSPFSPVKAALYGLLAFVVVLGAGLVGLRIYTARHAAKETSAEAPGAAKNKATFDYAGSLVKAARLPTPILAAPDPSDPVGAVLITVAQLDHNIPETLLEPPTPDNPESLQREKEVAEAMATAAHDGYPNAEYAYARILLQGRIGKPDPAASLEWLRRAAQSGQVHAQMLFGWLAGYGAGMKRDIDDTYLWWNIASLQGNDAAAIGRDKIAVLLQPQDLIRLQGMVKKWKEVKDQLRDPPLPLAQQQAQAVALIRAAADGDEKKVRQILSKGGDPNVVDEAGHTALINACWRGQEATVEVLLTAGADQNFVGTDGRTALGWAAANKYIDVVRTLIESGASVDIPDRKGLTPLMRAAWLGYVNITALLLQAGANPHLTDESGKNAGDYAKIDGTPDLLKLFNAS
ncbi:MAG TPA: ankyrin repeat domain-containing protein [Alphaproteobacteria bacterium]|nr:ankyrin repeat domain-containing protein [Alphaproteobacteria bacterium]